MAILPWKLFWIWIRISSTEEALAFSDKDTAIATHDTLSSYGIMSLSSIEGYKLGCDVEDVYRIFTTLEKYSR